MPGLAYDALDRQVIDGLGEQAVWTDSEHTWSYAELLADSSAIAGGLRLLGLTAGDRLALDLDRGWPRLQLLLAAIRLGLVIDGGADLRIHGDPAAIALPTETVEVRVVLRLGRNDPYPAPEVDPVDHWSHLGPEDRDALGVLLDGGSLHHG